MPSSGQDSAIQAGELSLRWLTVQIGVDGGSRSRSSKWPTETETCSRVIKVRT